MSTSTALGRHGFRDGEIGLLPLALLSSCGAALASTDCTTTAPSTEIPTARRASLGGCRDAGDECWSDDRQCHQESAGDVPQVPPGTTTERSVVSGPQESPGDVPQVPPGTTSRRFSSPSTASDILQGMSVPTGVSQSEVDSWTAKVAKLHRAASHPTNRNLAWLIQEAGHAPWQVEIARQHRCPACLNLQPGGTSSKQILPAATHQQYAAWEAVAIDSGEWVPPNRRVKVKFLMFMDAATKLRAVQPLFVLDFLQMRAETTDDLRRSLCARWLGVFPKPKYLLLDSAKKLRLRAVSRLRLQPQPQLALRGRERERRQSRTSRRQLLQFI